MNRYFKYISILCVFALVLNASGCASILTEGGHLESRLENGTTSVGRVVDYKYSGFIQGNVGYLYKTPLCAKMVEKVRVAQKNPKGLGFILAEMLLFGFGFIDMSMTRAVVEESRVTQPLAVYESSQTEPCGEKQPAAHEEIVIYVRPAVVDGDQPKSYFQLAATDANGVIDFNKLFPHQDRPLNLNVRLASDESRAISFLFKPLP